MDEEQLGFVSALLVRSWPLLVVLIAWGLSPAFGATWTAGYTAGRHSILKAAEQSAKEAKRNYA